MNFRTPARLAAVRALAAGRLHLTWADGGPTVIVDLSRDIARLKSLTRLREAAQFRQARLGEGGHSVEWPIGVDIGADSLWRDTLLTQGYADTVEFNDWRLRAGLSLAGAAEALGLSRRMVAYYGSGAKRVPKTVLLACEGWAARQARAAA